MNVDMPDWAIENCSESSFRYFDVVGPRNRKTFIVPYKHRYKWKWIRDVATLENPSRNESIKTRLVIA